jgi:predicted nucleic-acid-binding protein
MIGIDSNILLRWVVDDGSHAKQARIAADAIQASTVHVSVVTLVEVLWVLRTRYRLSARDRVAFLETLATTSNVVVQHLSAVRSAIRDVARYGGDIPDHLLAALNEEAGCSHTLTFDRKAGRSPKFMRLSQEEP